MSVKKVGGGVAVVHCHGKDRGKPIKVFRGKDAEERAQAMHRAIQAKKHSGKSR